MARQGPRVVVVTARQRLLRAWSGPARSWQQLLGEQVRGALLGGADLVQVREADVDAGPLSAFLRRLFADIPGSRARVVVNERLDVALAVEAAGVHLPERSLAPEQARALAVDPGWLVGRSVHSAGEARTSTAASYLMAGTVLPSASKTPGGPTLGWDGLRGVVEAAGRVPVVAIGGLTEGEVPQALAAGAAGVAAIGYYLPTGDGDIAAFVQERVMQMRLAFDTHTGVPYTQGLDR